MNPYPSDWELRASLFANRKTATGMMLFDMIMIEGDSADKQSITSTQRVGRNDLSDMDVEDGESGTVADEEVLIIYLNHVDNVCDYAVPVP